MGKTRVLDIASGLDWTPGADMVVKDIWFLSLSTCRRGHEFLGIASGANVTPWADVMGLVAVWGPVLISPPPLRAVLEAPTPTGRHFFLASVMALSAMLLA